ncbi:MAG: hypothetical protein ACT443_00920, partial [Gemmatimonadota bacterium]
MTEIWSGAEVAQRLPMPACIAAVENALRMLGQGQVSPPATLSYDELTARRTAAATVQEANELLREWPRLLNDLNGEDRRVLPDAGSAGNAGAVDLMLAIRFDAAATGQDGGTVLHCAAWQGAAACIESALPYSKARALIEVRDRVHGSTPLGWCCHGARYCANQAGDYPAVARLLL